MIHNGIQILPGEAKGRLSEAKEARRGRNRELKKVPLD